MRREARWGGTPEHPLDWSSDVTLVNFGEAARVRASFLPWDTDNSDPQTIEFDLVPGKVETVPDAVGTWFGRTGAGAVRFDSTDPLGVTSRTYSFDPDLGVGFGTRGQTINGIPVASLAETASKYIFGLKSDPDPESGFRSNFGIVNTTDMSITLEVHLLDGLTTIGSFPVVLPPNGTLQVHDAFRGLSDEAIEAGTIIVDPVSEGAAFAAYGSVVDVATGDANYIPGFLPFFGF